MRTLKILRNFIALQWPQKAKQAHFRDLLLRIRHLYGQEYHSGHYAEKYMACCKIKIRAKFGVCHINKA